jgi:hypothetical protein
VIVLKDGEAQTRTATAWLKQAVAYRVDGADRLPLDEHGLPGCLGVHSRRFADTSG